jgi:hypothetical protein
VKLTVVRIREADAELKEAHAWYENIRPELGERFARAVEATVEAITESGLWSFNGYAIQTAARTSRQIMG